MKSTVSADVVLGIRIPVGSTWGSECSMDQIVKQASEEAVNSVRAKFNPGGVEILWTKVTAVIATESKVKTP